MNEYDAIWYGQDGSGHAGKGPNRVVCTIVGLEHVYADGRVVLRAIAIPMTGGAPFSAPASEFKVTDGTMRKP